MRECVREQADGAASDEEALVRALVERELAALEPGLNRPEIVEAVSELLIRQPELRALLSEVVKEALGGGA